MIADARPFPPREVARRLAAHLWGIVVAGQHPGSCGTDRVVPLDRRTRRATGAAPAALATTLERAARLIPASRTVAVLCRDGARDLDAGLEAFPAVQRVVQPRYRGSAAEVFLPLLRIAREDPEAIVAVLPAEAVAGAGGRIMHWVSRAVSAVALRPEMPVLVGGRARATESLYGWIEPGLPVEGLEDLAIRSVKRFVHDRLAHARRGPVVADGLLGAIVLTGAARTLLGLGERYLPDVLETLEPLPDAFGRAEESLLCEAVYECMPYASIARELLERDQHFGVLPIPDALATECCEDAMQLIAS